MKAYSGTTRNRGNPEATGGGEAGSGLLEAGFDQHRTPLGFDTKSGRLSGGVGSGEPAKVCKMLLAGAGLTVPACLRFPVDIAASYMVLA
jgi:hypothetical protein